MLEIQSFLFQTRTLTHAHMPHTTDHQNNLQGQGMQGDRDRGDEKQARSVTGKHTESVRVMATEPERGSARGGSGVGTRSSHDRDKRGRRERHSHPAMGALPWQNQGASHPIFSKNEQEDFSAWVEAKTGSPIHSALGSPQIFRRGATNAGQKKPNNDDVPALVSPLKRPIKLGKADDNLLANITSKSQLDKFAQKEVLAWFRARYLVTALSSDFISCEELYRSFQKANKKTAVDKRTFERVIQSAGATRTMRRNVHIFTGICYGQEKDLDVAPRVSREKSPRPILRSPRASSGARGGSSSRSHSPRASTRPLDRVQARAFDLQRNTPRYPSQPGSPRATARGRYFGESRGGSPLGSPHGSPRRSGQGSGRGVGGGGAGGSVSMSRQGREDG